MASWKKVIVSGSNAVLNQISASGDIVPTSDAGSNLGSATREWNNLYIDGTANIDSLVADTADINAGTIDGTTIATSNITVGSGKTLNVSAGTLTLAANQISGDAIEGGTIGSTTISTLTTAAIEATSDIDIGAHGFRAKTLTSDIAIGTAPLTVTSTTRVQNLQASTVGTIAGLAPDTATTQATQGNITSLGTLSSLTVSGDITANGNIVGDDTTDVTNIRHVYADQLRHDGDTTTMLGFSDNIIDLNTNGTIRLRLSNAGALFHTGHVTASGNISSSGAITANRFIGDVEGNAATSTLATSITATANNTANETTYLTFVDGATGTQGLETDTGLSYNPSSGLLSTAALVTSGQVQAEHLKSTDDAAIAGTLTVGDITNVNTTHVTASSNISASGLISADTYHVDGMHGVGVLGNVLTFGHETYPSAVDGSTLHLRSNVTASGTISASGTVAMSTATINGGIFTSASLGAAIASSITAGDITGVTAGDGLQDGGTTGNVTLNIDVSDFVGTGLEANGEDIRLATQGTGISGGGGSTLSVTPAQTAITSVYNTSLKVGRDSQNLIDFSTTDNKLILRANNINQVSLVDNIFSPEADSDVDLGAPTKYWKNAYIDTVTTTGAVVIGGDLTVNGTTTSVATTNIEVKDQFLFLASGSQGSNIDAGIVVQSGSAAGSGSALYHDNSAQRWAVAKGVAKDSTAAQAHLQYVTTVKTSTSAPGAGDADYGIGEMWIETDTQDIYIRTA